MIEIIETNAATWLRRKVAINGVSFFAKFVATLLIGASAEVSTSILFIVNYIVYVENVSDLDILIYLYVGFINMYI